MKTPLDREIRQRVAAVLSGESRLRDFYHWFMPATWEVDCLDDAECDRMIRDITHAFSEFTSGMLTPTELRRALESAVSTKASSTRDRVA